MLEITKEQFLSFDDINKIRIIQAMLEKKIVYVGDKNE